ncbi:MAG: recombinase family protein [Azospirillum sp.]|nr:recombinase family protein [Azospirillum sp.]MCA3264706.1 recombinase family protein [Azospirillum sp.]
MKAVAYYRVSTDKQGKSGLGLDAQRDAVRRFLRDDYPPIKEYREVESGKRSDRPELRKALAFARINNASLIVAKVDRLTRNVAFLEAVLASGVEVVFCDIPQVQGAMGRFILQQMAAVAQLEAGLISERTKAALQAAKARGTKLGGYRGVKVDPALGTAARKAKANEIASRYADTIKELHDKIEDLQGKGSATAYALAKALNERDIPSPRGGRWQATTVNRLLARL